MCIVECFLEAQDTEDSGTDYELISEGVGEDGLAYRRMAPTGATRVEEGARKRQATTTTRSVMTEWHPIPSTSNDTTY